MYDICIRQKIDLKKSDYKIKIQEKKKMETYLKCEDFLDEDKIEELLVPRYNK
jgi:hypothetical protein